VLLDFRGTLVHSFDFAWYASRAIRALGRADASIEPTVQALKRIFDVPGFEDDDAVVDTSVEIYRETMRRWFTSVGVDEDLAEALVDIDFDPVSWPVYPDAPDVVRAVRSRGCATALVSDFHADVVPHLAAHGIELDAAVLSFEHGFQKPDPRMFKTALEAVGAEPHEALMVGDRAERDGGAAAVGVDALILPAPAGFGVRGLDVVVGMIG
jgi:HAD superfamily hydrolase (TIGR01509 family)